jgi:hypothetical protein
VYVHEFEVLNSEKEAMLAVESNGITQKIKILGDSVEFVNQKEYLLELETKSKNLKEVIEKFEEIECEAPEILPYKLVNEQYFDLQVNTFYEKLENWGNDLLDLVIGNLKEFLSFCEEDEVGKMGNAQLNELMFNLKGIVDMHAKDPNKLNCHLTELMTIYQN